MPWEISWEIQWQMMQQLQLWKDYHVKPFEELWTYRVLSLRSTKNIERTRVSISHTFHIINSRTGRLENTLLIGKGGRENSHFLQQAYIFLDSWISWSKQDENKKGYISLSNKLKSINTYKTFQRLGEEPDSFNYLLSSKLPRISKPLKDH